MTAGDKPFVTLVPCLSKGLGDEAMVDLHYPAVRRLQ